MLLGSERRSGSGDRLKRFEPLVGYGVRRRSASVGGGIEAKLAAASSVRDDLQQAQARIRELETQLASASSAQEDLQRARAHIEQLQARGSEVKDKLERAKSRIQELEAQIASN